MKVLVVSDVIGEENNGTTIACMNLVRYLQSQGDEVRVLCCDQDKKDMVNYFIVPTLSLGCLLDYIVKKNNVTLAKPNTKIIKKALEGVDVCHIMLPFGLGIKTLKIARKMGIPCTSGFHCQAENFSAHLHMMNFTSFNNAVYKHFYKKFYKYVDAIHYPTEFIKDVFESTVKKKTNAYVISNGVNDLYKKQEVQRVAPYDKHFNILFIGRYSKEKSHHLLIKAVARSKYKNNIQLIFAGQGPYEKSLQKLAISTGINKPIMKFYSRDELVNVINSSDLYVHPAEIEIEAISCLEAITCGLVPVISDSKRSATNRFALSEKNLFKNNSVYDLARKIDYWIEHPKEKEECSKQYLGYTTQFAQDVCMKRMRDMLLEYSREECHTSLPKTYYEDELNDDFANTNIKQKSLGNGFKYVHKNIIWRFFAFIFYYVIASPLVWLIQKIFTRQKFVNKKAFKQAKNTGYFIYSNHTNYMNDAFIGALSNWPKKCYLIANPDATSIKGIRTLVQMLGAIPLGTTVKESIDMFNCVETRIKQNNAIIIYPEAHIWPFYTKIRPFNYQSFKYPAKYNKPIFVLTNCYQKSRFFKTPKVVTFVDGPFYPNLNLNINDAAQDLRNTAYITMSNRVEEYSTFEFIRYIKKSENK